MSRVLRLSRLANDWGHGALYVCAMGALGASAFFAAHALSSGIWHAAVATSSEAPRPLSRVDKYFLAKANVAYRPQPGIYRPVVALVRPDIHPAALAAAMDRTELASAHEYPEHHRLLASRSAEPSSELIDLASWRGAAVQVAGLSCSEAGCRDAQQIALNTDPASDTNVAAANAANSDNSSAIAEDASAEAEAATKAMAKPYRLSKGRAVARQKSSKKFMTQFGDEPPGKYYSGPDYPGLRVAETPGDIIRRTLRGTI